MDAAVSSKIEGFFSGYKLSRYPAGQILILAGDETEYIFHMVKGKVKQYDVTYRGEEIILNVFKPPAFFPMSLAINKDQNPYIYEAETDVELHRVPAGDAVEFIKSNPDVQFDLLSRVYRGLDGLMGRMSHLMASSAKSRLMYELVLESLRFGEKNGSEYVLSLTEKDLGARAGLSRETVNREISKLKKDGLITVSHNAMIVKDLKSLESKLKRDIST